jgi:hypothetical protein
MDAVEMGVADRHERFYLLVVWYVLEHLCDGPEKTIVPILGLIHVAVRGIGYGGAFLAGHLILAIEDINHKLNRLVDPIYEREHGRALTELKEAGRTIRARQALDYLDWLASG